MNPNRMLIDIFITTCKRPKLLEKSLESFFKNINSKDIRLTLVQDGYDVETSKILEKFNSKIDNLLVSSENLGLAPSFNKTIFYLDQLNNYYNYPTHGDSSKVSEFLVYCQDDILYSENWLEKLLKWFLIFENQHKLVFASGIESVEHPIIKELGNGMLLKNWVRLTCLLARRQSWIDMLPIPILDPETGKVRGKPNDGLGSSVDWWFCRNHEKSLIKSGRNCLVIPGMLQHLGYNSSTWLKRSLPESENDLKIINEKK